ncbi:nuclear transport factor 2 family protein [Streptomyces ureilyticus]|uniref:Nuclear transport factor 2 family protein n=1 Tax=Streptomyces ureilyticus TaxID=1775131 RepID=A0ABX0DXE4_9ACTN|nr:nuclear transport factor 2 family protein [Streptomyces ureilyticus]NGO45174.1 nuclear transport factor 2 family protein [Streptomyces ureilyticus]
MSWTRGFLAAFAVCALLGALFAGITGCDSGGRAGEDNGAEPSPVGKVLEDTDEEGRNYREVDKKRAPDVGIEVLPDARDGWNVRLTVDDFRFSPSGGKKAAVQGRGYALLRVDGRPVAELRDPTHHLPGSSVARGTHKITVRLHADDDTVWAVDGEPVERTADITVSDPEPSAPTTSPAATSPTPTPQVSGRDPGRRTGGRGSPDQAGKA